MYEQLHYALAPYYLYIKLVHLPFAFLWAFSVFMGYSNFLVPVVQAWRRNPRDPELVPMRNWVFERFDEGVAVEHVAFPMLVLTGILLIIAGGWGPESGWLVLKLAIVVAMIVPIEIVDYWISHMNGNKRYLRDKDGGEPDWDAYEAALHRHWWFFLVTTPMVVVIALGIFYLAITKPF